MIAQLFEPNRRVPEWRASRPRSLGTQRDIVTGSLYLAANMHDGLPSLPGDVVTRRCARS